MPPPYNLPHERHYPTRIHIPRVVPDNVYGNRHPVDIEREIANKHEWTWRVLGEPTVEQDIPMPAVEEPLLPLTPIPLNLPTDDIDDLYAPAMDIDMMIQLGHHYLLNQIMKQAAKHKEGIPYHFSQVSSG